MENKRDILSITDLSKEEIWQLFDSVEASKISRETETKVPLANKSIALLFQKPSLRTRVSFEVAIQQLGGHPIYLSDMDLRIGERETISDIARVLSRYVNGIVARVYAHTDIVEMAKYASVPVINALSNLFHPCQILADLYTINNKLGKLEGINLTFIGDGRNNVAHTLLLGAAITGMNIRFAVPAGYEPFQTIMDEARKIAHFSGSNIEVLHSPEDAVANAEVLYTDVWISMGEEILEEKKKVFMGYQINQELLELANEKCLVMHCLPAHRDEEITEEVLEGVQSIVFEQAENRLYIQQAILYKIFCVS